MALETLLAFLFLFLLIFYLIQARISTFQLFTRLGIPGPRPNLIFGNFVGGKKLITEVMDKWEAQYGEIYGYYRGTRPVLVVRNPSLIKDILERKSENFINRPLMVMNVPPIRDSVVGLRGQRWKEVRKSLSPMLSSSAKIKQMFPIFKKCLDTTIEILRQNHENKKIVDAHKLFQGLACEVIGVTALAMKVDSQRNQQDRFLLAVKGFLENAMGPFVKTALCFPLLARVMEWALETFGYSHEMTTMIMESVKEAMKIRRKEQEKLGVTNGNGWVAQHTDVLQFMMDATPALSEDEIIANCWIFILGGFETTSSALSYTCYLLSIHQDVQDKLFAELSSKLGFDETPSYETISELTYLEQVICESLRLYPPVVSFIVRGLESENTKIGPYVVPKNVGIQIPVWQIHHGKNYSDPYSFNPDRFVNKVRNMEFIPFGAGPRSCLGMRFALLNLKFTLCSILRKFQIQQPSSTNPYKLKLKIPSVTIVPDGGVPLKFIPRDCSLEDCAEE